MKNSSYCFKDSIHEEIFRGICSRMKYLDCYHLSLAYLLALDNVLRNHVNDVFDFRFDCIKRDVLNKGFQTSTSKKTTRLAFNLWNGCHTDGKIYIDEDGYKSDLPSRYYAVDNIFCCSYAPYYWQAIQLRFPEYSIR